MFPANQETKSQTFSTLISLSCVLLLIPPHGLWSSDRRALQRIKGFLCSAVRGCRPLAGRCNQILPTSRPRALGLCTSPVAAGAGQGWSRHQGYKLDLPEPPPSQPGFPSIKPALLDVQGGGPKINPPSVCRHSSAALAFWRGREGSLLVSAWLPWEGLLEGPASLRG